MIRQLLVATLCIALPMVASASDEREHLNSIAKEMANLSQLVSISQESVANEQTRISFDYSYVIDALDYLERSVADHVSQIESELDIEWDLNSREEMSQIRIVSERREHVLPVYRAAATERENLVSIVRDMELVRILVKKSVPASSDDKGPVYFDYAYVVEVLGYIEFAIRSHMSLQNGSTRTQWDTRRYQRLTSNRRTAAE